MYQSELAERYVRAVVKEIASWQEVESTALVDTIYLGGGTPSLLSAAQLEVILQAMYDRFEVQKDAEVTLEINPGDGGETRSSRQRTLSEFRALGITRASFGAQTFDDDELRQLGRTHAASDIGQTFRDLRAAGFDNLNFDLIAGLPSQSLAGWKRNLDAALGLGPDHLSLYLLDVHEGTPLADQIKRGMRPQPDEDLTAEMYRLMIETVCAAGYEHYEISNFCLPGYEARHNTKYWMGSPYYGFGCSAHSYDGKFRRWVNERDAAGYSAMIEAGQSPIVERTELTEQDVRAESMFLGLRMMRGLDLHKLELRFGADPLAPYRDDLERFGEAGLIEVDHDMIKLTRSGALLSNEVFAAFV
jgi:oxygen-independent coproporphyrinogen-3 oxidase